MLKTGFEPIFLVVVLAKKKPEHEIRNKYIKIVCKKDKY